ncbi:MAG TPA: META domain-containing protein [Acidimicrobiia bacterium]|nr:META domain-containing protein [Acidimicrobiia bacterium]
MRDITRMAILLPVALVLVACGGAGPATAAPAATPQTAAATLEGTVWQWTQTTETQPASQSVVPDPENYSIVFGEDGQVVIQADCNVVQGAYESSDSSLTISPGPSTMAFCGEMSSDTFFLGYLEQVDTFELKDGTLVLGFGGGAGTMTFADAGAAAGTGEAVARGIEWQWSELTEAEPASQSVVPNPESYTLTFQPDGTYAVKADCNQVLGAYTVQDQVMTISPGPSTLALCDPESLDTMYLDLLSRVTSFSLEGGTLTLFVDGNAARMVFYPAE